MAKKQISCLPVSLFQSFFDKSVTVADWAEFAAAQGLDYIDINRRCLLDMNATQVEEIAAQLKLPVLMVTTYSDFTNPTAQGFADAVAAAKEDLKLTAALGAKYLRLTAGQNYPDQPEDKTIAQICKGFEECLPLAEKLGIGLLLENHSKPGAWQYPDFNFHLERMLKLWDKIKELPIGINFDTANAYAVGDWKALVTAFGSRIETIHINDISSVTPLKFCCVGEGIVPQQEMLKEVRKYGFNGVFCIEEACMRGKEGIETAVKATKAILQNI